MEEVLEKCIKPFLLGKPDDQLYLVKLGKEKIDYEQELRIQAEKERKKRDKIAKQYADNLVLAMGPAERAYQDYFGFTETLTQEERKWEKILLVKIEQNGLSRPNNTKKSWKKTNELQLKIQLKESRSRPGSSIPIFVSFLKKKPDLLGSY